MLRFTMIALALLVVFYQPQATIALAPVRTLNDYSVPELIEHFASQYGVSSKVLLDVAFCESSYRQSAIGDSGKAKGIFQFHQPTWESFTEKMGEELDRDSAIDQAKVAAWAFSNRLGSHWTCYTRLYK